MQWAYGVTTVAERRFTTLPRTLDSLESSGFIDPRLFIDLDSEPEALQYKSLRLPMTTRVPRLQTYGNWYLTLIELYIREPKANRYAIFQDDLVTSKNLKAYLETQPYKPKTYWNLYTFMDNEPLLHDANLGFIPSNQRGRSAVALIFDNAAVQDLIGCRHMIEKPQAARKPTKSVDGAVVTALRSLDYTEMVHNPSLVQHTGNNISSIGNQTRPLAISFRGEQFDLMQLCTTIT